MTIINYVEDGINYYTKNNCQTVIAKLHQAKNLSASISSPGNFNYKNYITALSGTIQTYYQEMLDIDAKIKYADNKYEELTLDMTADANRLDTEVIKDRDRLII